MGKSKGTKWIGDYISHDGKNKENVKKRVSIGMGTNTSIMVILKETSLGIYYFSIAMILRETILMSSMLLNIEVWFAVTREDISKLQMVDKVLLRRVMEIGKGSPVCGLYLETGSIPISYLIKARRIMFLHYLVSLD